MRKTGNNQYLKKMNQSTVLELIRTNEGISRIELAEKTGLSATAISAIVKSLLKDRYIEEIGEGKSSGGRKPTMLKIKPDSYYSFGFDVDVKFIYTILVDITGKVIYEKKYETDSVLGPDETVDRISDIYSSMIQNLKIRPECVLGVGLSIPGLIDIHTKKIILAPNMGWNDVSIQDKLREKLSTTVYIENESMCSAICESWLGICRGTEDFICINIESGIGSGIFVRGMIYRGSTGSAGEVGHIPVPGNALRCKCGKKGCLEAVASVNAMVAKYRESSEFSEDSMSGMDDGDIFGHMINNARNGEIHSLRIFQDAAVSLGQVIGYLINAFNPQQIVLGKKFTQFSDLVLEIIRYEASRTALTYPAHNCRILASSFGENSSALGAAIIPVRKLFGY
ncbi:MAG TPA: ROK family transcriptional regulator [Clostridiaceae bacterium]|nr:ROK family transcriptional regulator [Clostridiaceae bacterium]